MKRFVASSLVLCACESREPPGTGSWTPISEGPIGAVAAGDAADFGNGTLFVLNASGQAASYHVGSNAWHALPSTTPRAGAVARWANDRVLVFGGAPGPGAVFTPATNAWTAMATANAPAPHEGALAAWTGDRLIVWGGQVDADPLHGNAIEGGIYDPVHDAWTPMSPAGAPSGRRRATSVWTGTRFIVWGGQAPDATPLGDGASFDPIANTWTALPMLDAPGARYLHTAAWTGAVMFVWGGVCPADDCADGARYDPAANAWKTISPRDSAGARVASTAVWSGREVLIWAGEVRAEQLVTGNRWEPLRDAWTRIQTNEAPAARSYAFAFWTGDRMLVYGGGTTPTSGGLFTP